MSGLYSVEKNIVKKRNKNKNDFVREVIVLVAVNGTIAIVATAVAAAAAA